MKDATRLIARRTLLRTVPLGIAGTILLKAEPADAFLLGIIFRVASMGYGRALFATGLATTILAVGAVQAINYGLHSMFGRRSGSSSGSGGSYDSYSPGGWSAYKPPEPIVINVSFKPTERIKGDVLRILAIEHDLLKNDGIILPRGGRLMIEEDGKMRFADTKFRGHAYMQNNRDLTVWTPDNELMLTRTPRENKLHNIHHDSDDGRLALVSLLGEIKHV